MEQKLINGSIFYSQLSSKGEQTLIILELSIKYPGLSIIILSEHCKASTGQREQELFRI